MKLTRKELFAFGAGIVLGGLLTHTTLPATPHHFNNNHSITQPDEEYHVHADFLIYVNDEKIDLARAELMTTADNHLHEEVHLHDGNGEVVHIHHSGISFAEFLESLSITLTSDCLSLEGETFCTSDTKQLELYVNYAPFEGDITTYEPVDDDAILLYYGDYNPEKITTYMNDVADDACYYSGTCPERGIAPPESCGLTCEL